MLQCYWLTLLTDSFAKKNGKTRTGTLHKKSVTQFRGKPAETVYIIYYKHKENKIAAKRI